LEKAFKRVGLLMLRAARVGQSLSIIHVHQGGRTRDAAYGKNAADGERRSQSEENDMGGPRQGIKARGWLRNWQITKVRGAKKGRYRTPGRPHICFHQIEGSRSTNGLKRPKAKEKGRSELRLSKGIKGKEGVF